MFIIMVAVGVAFPIVPLYVQSFGVGYGAVGLFIGTFGFARLFGDLIGGSVIDRKGERWTAMTGMSLLAVCATATGLAPNYGIAIVFWGLAGFGSAVSSSVAFTYVVKAAPKDRVGRVLSFFFGAFNIGIVIGGAVGGFVAAKLGLAAPLFVYAGIFAFGALIYVPRFVRPLEASRDDPLPQALPPDALATEAPLPSKRPVRSMLGLPGFFTAMTINLAYLWMVGAVFNTLLSLFARDGLGISTAGIGALFSLALAVELIVLFPAGAWADRYGRKKVLIPGLLGLAMSLAAMGFSTSAWMLALALVGVALTGGFAGVPPAAMVSDVVPRDQSGRAMGAFRFFGDLGFLLGPLIAGLSSQNFGFEVAFILTAIPCLVALTLTIRTPETLKLKRA